MGNRAAKRQSADDAAAAMLRRARTHDGVRLVTVTVAPSPDRDTVVATVTVDVGGSLVVARGPPRPAERIDDAVRAALAFAWRGVDMGSERMAERAAAQKGHALGTVSLRVDPFAALRAQRQGPFRMVVVAAGLPLFVARNGTFGFRFA